MSGVVSGEADESGQLTCRRDLQSKGRPLGVHQLLSRAVLHSSICAAHYLHPQPKHTWLFCQRTVNTMYSPAEKGSAVQLRRAKQAPCNFATPWKSLLLSPSQAQGFGLKLKGPSCALHGKNATTSRSLCKKCTPLHWCTLPQGKGSAHEKEELPTVDGNPWAGSW